MLHLLYMKPWKKHELSIWNHEPWSRIGYILWVDDNHCYYNQTMVSKFMYAEEGS